MENHLKSSPVEIGERIAKRRKQLNMTQEQAAERSGLSHQFFACVERGSKNMRAESIIKLSKALDMSTDYILLGKSNDSDRKYLLELLEPLDEVQLKCMEDIMKSYLVACGHIKPLY